MSERSQDPLWDLLRGALGTRAVAIVAELGVPDVLAEGPRPVAEVAHEVGADPDTLYRLLRALASEGLFAEEEPGVFRNTDASERLRGGWARLRAPLWRDLLPGVGRPGRVRRIALRGSFGSDFWTWLKAHPEERGAFDRAMEQGKGAGSSG